MTTFQRMLAMVQELLVQMSASEGEIEDAIMDLDAESVIAADEAENDEYERQSDVLEELRQVLESARGELEGIVDIQPEPETEEV